MVESLESIKKYNLWYNNTIETGYKRHLYTDKINQSIGNNLVKVIVGQRRTGKSYILRQIASELVHMGVSVENILYVNKEYIEFNSINTFEDLQLLYNEYKKQFHPSGKVYLFIDEIQYIDEWERFVNSHSQDFSEPCEIFISGSNSKLLSGELATLLSGRYVEFEILPYSFKEYCEVTGNKVDRASYFAFLQGGALPELFNIQSEEIKRNYISSIKDTVMLRDIIARYKIKDTQLLDDLFTFAVNNAANYISINNIINYFASKKRKTNYETISSYLEYLENSFLIHRSERYNIRGKETISGNCKYYINDLGYHNYLYSGFGYGVGHLLENAVYLDLRRSGYDIYTGEIKEKEVDFVAIKGEKRIYIQVCQTLTEEQTIKREYLSLKNINDNYPKYVISLDEYHLASNEGIEHRWPWEIEVM